MKKSLKTLRPVGNPIKLHKESLDYTQFGDFHVDFYHSGTAALATAIIAIKQLLSDKSTSPEVILPAYACPDLISAILYAGATPVLVDLEPDSYWMSLDQVEQHVSENTIAIIAVRFLGIAERMLQLLNICKKYELLLIEDSAQGFPLDSPDTYWQGDVIIVSFGRGKPINLLGGGAVLTKNEAIKSHLSATTSHGETSSQQAKYRVKVFAYNFLINPMIYGIALKLPGLSIGETSYKPLQHISGIPPYIAVRLNANIHSYKGLPNISMDIKHKLEQLQSAQIIDLASTSQHDFANPLLRYPVLINDKKTRDSLHNTLMSLGSSIMYQQPLYKIKGIPVVSNRQNTDFVNAESFADRLLTLPTHKAVSSDVLKEIFARIRKTIM
jgi:dTDP-4-amino-4,6-dideoxygalactose transaminase